MTKKNIHYYYPRPESRATIIVLIIFGFLVTIIGGLMGTYAMNFSPSRGEKYLLNINTIVFCLLLGASFFLWLPRNRK